MGSSAHDGGIFEVSEIKHRFDGEDKVFDLRDDFVAAHPVVHPAFYNM